MKMPSRRYVIQRDEFYMTVPNPYGQLNSTLLDAFGLNMQASFRLADLPQAVADALSAQVGAGGSHGSFILLGNGGNAFWDSLPEAAWQQAHPLDTHSIQCVKEYLLAEWPGVSYQVLYPGELPVGLQSLGRVVGWHSDSPLKLGINPVFGLWYAYRALIWIETILPTTTPVSFDAPCAACADKPCISACPANALSGDVKQLNTCIDYRLTDRSSCQSTCLARKRCPIAKQHQYSEQQLNYQYQQSFETLLSWRS